MSAKPIVAATDGSAESMRAVDWAVREAALRGAPLRIVSAAALLPRMIGGHAMSGNDAEADALRIKRDQALAAAAERAAKSAPGLLIDADAVDGQPGEAVTNSGSGALMLVVGSRGTGEFAAMILGSVSRHAATHASCPVVVVRAPAEPDAPAGRHRHRRGGEPRLARLRVRGGGPAPGQPDRDPLLAHPGRGLLASRADLLR